MKELLPFLKQASSNKEYPIYASYLHSDGKSLSTYDNYLYMKFDYEAPFKGDVNIFMLDSILHNLKEYTIKQQSENKLFIEGSGAKYNIVISNYNFPDIQKEITEYKYITDELLNLLKYASFFLGNDIYSYIYIDKDKLVATNINKLFYHKFENFEINPLLISKRLLSVISNEASIGIIDNTIGVKYQNGIVLQAIPKVESYPIDRISTYLEKETKNLKLIVNIALIRDAISKLNPIFSGEKATIINIANKHNKCRLIAESALNGRAVVEINSDLEDIVDINVNSKYLKNISYDYDLFINDNNNLVCRNDDDSFIIFKGE